MRSQRRRTARGAAILGITALLGSGGTVSVTAQDLPDLRLAFTQAPLETGLNPFLATAGADYTLIADRYDLLIEYGPDYEPAPGLAESWTVSDDGLVWTFDMRDGVTWHDGTPFTSEDARFTLQYIFDSHDPAYTGPAAPDGNDVDGDGAADSPLSLFDSYLDLEAGIEESSVAAIEAPDPDTLVLTLLKPVPTLTQAYVPIVPKHIWEGITFADASVINPTIEQAIGTGPFKVVEFDRERAVVLEANPSYWGGAPHVGRLIYQFYDNDEAQVADLVSGNVDFLTNWPPTLAETLLNAEGVSVNIARGTDFAELGFNSWDPTPERFEAEGCADCPRGPTTGSMGDPWLTRPEVRAALAGLLDKQAIIEQALNGYGEPGVSVVSPLNPLYAYQPPPDDPVTFPAYTDEAGQAAARTTAEERFRTAMAALGFEDTDGNGILNVPSDEASLAFDPEGAGADWSLRLNMREDDEEDKLAGELIEVWFEAAGVDIAFEPVSEDRMYEITYPSSSNADMDLYIWGFGPDPDPQFILSIFTCNQINGWQDANYCDAEYDELYQQQGEEADLEVRADIVQRMQEQIYHDAPYAVLWYINDLEAYRSDRFEGFNATPASGGSFWGIYGMGPYGSRVSVGPIGAAGGTPPPIPAASTAP